MNKQNHQKPLLDPLQNLQGLDPLEQLFGSELNYERENQLLSRRGWPDADGRTLVDHALITFLVHPTKVYFHKYWLANYYQLCKITNSYQ